MSRALSRPELQRVREIGSLAADALQNFLGLACPTEGDVDRLNLALSLASFDLRTERLPLVERWEARKLRPSRVADGGLGISEKQLKAGGVGARRLAASAQRDWLSEWQEKHEQ